MESLSNIFFPGPGTYLEVVLIKVGLVVKDLQNYNWNHNQYFKMMLFSKINLHFLTSNEISTEKKLKKVAFHKQYLSSHITHKNAKKTQTGQSILHAFKFSEKKRLTEAAVQRCSKEKVFWKNAANLQGNTHVEVRFQ